MQALSDTSPSDPVPGQVEVAVVGMGPWGLAVLERLVSGTIERGDGAPGLTVHVIEPGTPGPGLYGGDQPDYLILNTPCGQHSMYPFPGQDRGRRGTGFFEWAVSAGYQWVDDHCEVTTAGRPLTPHDFLPRRLMGEYLAWFYRCLVEESPPTLRVVHHRTTAVDVVALGRREQVNLASGDMLQVHHVVVTTGHTPNRTSEAAPVLAPYPISEIDRAVAPGSSVAVRGMGLVALDVVIALTVGRGGRFVRRDGHLRYEPSGREPRIALFSRSGYPYCAKSMGAADITDEHRPVICTPEAVAALRRAPEIPGAPNNVAAPRRLIDARRELLPLVLAEMVACFYAQSARLVDGPGAGRAITEVLGSAWRSGRFEQAVADLADRYGTFDAGQNLFVGESEYFVSSKDYQSRIAEAIESDVAAALVPGGASPLKHAFEVLRALRDTMRQAVEFGGLNPASHRDFQANVRNRVARIVAGPPVRRSEELLALVDAEVVRMPFGPSPAAIFDGEGVVMASRFLDRPHAERFDHLIGAHIDQPTVHDSASPVLARLFERGRLRQLRVDGEELGSVDLTDDFHPVAASGRPQETLWLYGALTEGARYYTAYLPSPSSRVRAFLDAQVCADCVLGAGS
ncbi:MAG: FAD/NAD(P)-binding protein [Acidimicrobiales bacterium]